MPELGTYGSVRGALSNERPYRNSGAPVKSKTYVTFVTSPGERMAVRIHIRAHVGVGCFDSAEPIGPSAKPVGCQQMSSDTDDIPF